MNIPIPKHIYLILGNQVKLETILYDLLDRDRRIYWLVPRSGIVNHGYELRLLFKSFRVLFKYNLKLPRLVFWKHLDSVPQSIFSAPVEYIQGRKYRKPITRIFVNERYSSILVPL